MKEPSVDLEAQSTLQASCLLSLITASSLEEIFERLTNCTGEWLDSDEVTLWWLNKHFWLVSSTIPPEQRKSATGVLPYEDAFAAGLLSSDEPVVLSERETHLSQIESGSSLAASIHYDKRILGLLIVHSKEPSHSWAESERTLLRLIAKSAGELCGNIETKKELSKLVELVQEFSQTTTSHDLYDLALTQGKELLGSDHATVYRLYPKESLLLHGVSSSKRNALRPLTPGEGATGLAIEQLQTIRIDDVTVPEWQGVYRSKLPSHDDSQSPDIRSELSVPIILRKCRIRIGTRSEFVNKPLGVLNFQSSAVGAFSTLDERCAQVLAEYVAQAIDRIEYDSKLSKISRASRALAFKRNWDSIVDTLLYSIRESLDYEFASLSIIDPDARLIRCVRAIGIPNADEFCRDYVFRLDSTHVTAEVVRERRVEVPAPNDPRQDDMSVRFGLDRLIRVFVPMISVSHEEVVGVISAGYDRSYRKHIYQRDVELLRMLTEFWAVAMETFQRSDLDRISHELNAPLTAVRANLEYLRRNRRNLSDEDIDRDLEDMVTDTQLLYYQVQKLEYIFAGAVAEVTKPLHIEPVRLFSDVIFKTINQLRGLVRDHGLDPKKISCSERDIHKLKPLNVDKSKISQVIFNLFMNAVKYAESPETFQIQISAEEEKDNYVIKFRDWGIGIPKEFEERVFDERFRAPIAAKRIRGSGLGLTIARQIMREHGGDLRLSNHVKPTEFQLIFPKSLRSR